MKSKDALAYLHTTVLETSRFSFEDLDDLLPLGDAITAVEIAEADAFKHACLTYQQLCPQKHGLLCTNRHYWINDAFSECMGVCAYMDNFRTKYKQ